MRVYTYLINSMCMCSVVLDTCTGIGPYGDSISFTFSVDQRETMRVVENDIIGFNWATRKVQSDKKISICLLLAKVQSDWISVGCPWLCAIALSQPNQQFVNCATASTPSLVCTHRSVCVCVLCLRARYRKQTASRAVRKGNRVSFYRCVN